MTRGVTYDTGALIAAERDRRSMWALHAGLLAMGITPTVPAPVVAQAWRGGAGQAKLARLLRMCRIEDLDHERAKAVGRLAGRANHDNIVDVTVVEGAARRGDSIVTTDRSDIEKVAAAVRW